MMAIRNGLFVFILSLSFIGVRQLVSASVPTRPNIIFVLADDLGSGDLGCYGQKLIETPHIDGLASQGIRFTQAYAGGSVCTPSRAVLMTGLHNGHSPARDNVPHYSTYLQENDVTLTKVLKQAGYRTGGVGKWSLGDAGTVGRATNQGFGTWLGYLNQDHAHYYFTEYLDDSDGRLELQGNSQTRRHYNHDLLVQRTLDFIRASSHDNRPFFCYAAFTLPHFSSKDEDSDGLTVPSTEPYLTRDWDQRSKKYAAMVTMLDRDIGRTVDLVDELKLTEKTLIIFTSDNGALETPINRFDSSASLNGFKRDLTEGGIRVPFIARWPKYVPESQVSQEIVAFQDMLPTLAELSGSALVPKCDGVSVTSALQGRPLDKPHEYLYWDYGHCRRRYDQAVRWKNWKGIRPGVGSDIQLFDLDLDPSEAKHVAARHPEVVQRIDQFMREAVTPNERYPIGKIYKGGPLWKRSNEV